MRNLLLLVCLLPGLAQANPPVYSVLVDELISVYDGDTFTVTIKAWPPIVGEKIPVRIAGVDAPEIRGKCEQEKQLALKAKEFTQQALLSAKTIELRNVRRGKYFRLIAEVFVDGEELSKGLIQDNLGRSYTGNKRESWCLNKQQKDS